MDIIDNIFPIYTEVSSDALTICKRINSKVFEYPFFNEGVNDLLDLQLNKEQCKLEDLKDSNANILEFKGFIFHTSHCGSTLLSRMFNVSSEIRVVPESEAINGLLMSYLLYDLSEDIVAEKLKKELSMHIDCQLVLKSI